MDRNLSIVANGFYAGAAALGVPSTVGFLFAGFTVLRLHWMKTPELRTSRSPDGMVDLLETGAHIFGKAFEFLGAAGEWILTALAVVLFFVALLSVVLFLTGRGLHRRQVWARILATLFALWLLLISLVSFLSIGRSAQSLLPLFAAAASVYVLWTLWRRFA